MDFSKLEELYKKHTEIREEIKKEKQSLCTQALNEKSLNDGDKIKFKDQEMFLNGLSVYNSRLEEAPQFYITFEAKKMKKDGTASLNNHYLYRPNFDLVEKV